MSLLTAITNVANKAGYTVDSSVISSTDVTTKQLLALTQDVIRDMGQAYPWPKLYATGTISLVNGTATYALPGDFSHYHFDTFYNQSDTWNLYGPISEAEYAETLGTGLTALPASRFQIRGISTKQLFITPTPSQSETLIFEYVSNRFARPRQWVSGLAVTTGTYIFNDGRYYTAAGNGTTGATPPTHTTGSVSDGAVTWAFYSGGYDSFVGDNDEPNLAQKILEQGILERFGELHGLSVVPRFDVLLNEEFSRQSPGKTVFAAAVVRPPYAFGRSGRVFFGS